MSELHTVSTDPRNPLSSELASPLSRASLTSRTSALQEPGDNPVPADGISMWWTGAALVLALALFAWPLWRWLKHRRGDR